MSVAVCNNILRSLAKRVCTQNSFNSRTLCQSQTRMGTLRSLGIPVVRKACDKTPFVLPREFATCFGHEIRRSRCSSWRHGRYVRPLAVLSGRVHSDCLLGWPARSSGIISHMAQPGKCAVDMTCELCCNEQSRRFFRRLCHVKFVFRIFLSSVKNAGGDFDGFA